MSDWVVRIKRETYRRLIKSVSPRAACLFLDILSFANKNNSAFPSITTLARNQNTSRRSIERCLEELETNGFITRDKRTGRTTLYHIHPNITCDKNVAGGEATSVKSVARDATNMTQGCDKNDAGGATDLSHRSSTNEVIPLKKESPKKGTSSRAESYEGGGARRLRGAHHPTKPRLDGYHTRSSSRTSSSSKGKHSASGRKKYTDPKEEERRRKKQMLAEFLARANLKERLALPWLKRFTEDFRCWVGELDDRMRQKLEEVQTRAVRDLLKLNIYDRWVDSLYSLLSRESRRIPVVPADVVEKVLRPKVEGRYEEFCAAFEYQRARYERHLTELKKNQSPC